MPQIRVLVVDDAPELLNFYQHLFVRAGMDVDTAENGLRALDVIRRERPAVVVTDVDMPEMDGLELCRVLRADPVLSTIPVVVVTGSGHDPVMEDSCHAVLEKPCSAATLLQTVLGALEGVRLARHGMLVEDDQPNHSDGPHGH